MNYLQQQKDRILEHYGEPTDLDDLARCCIAMCGTYDNAKQPRDRRRRRAPFEALKVVGFAWDVSYTPKVSNSHNRPINGMDNWGGYNTKKGAPDGYPGFTGRVWMRWATPCVSFISDPMKLTLTHTGTGGGGSYNGAWSEVCHRRYQRYGHKREAGMYPEIACSSFDYRFFLSDWPEIEADIQRQIEQVEKENVWRTLQNKPNEIFSLHHRFLWEDPETKAADEAFIRQCEGLDTAAVLEWTS